MIRARLADERGMTLVELLTTMVVGTVIIFAVLSITDTSLQVNAKNQDRIDAVDTGRAAMDKLTQRLGSQICLGTGSPALINAEDDMVEFYASLAQPSPNRLTYQRRRISYDAMRRSIVEDVYDYASGTPPTVTFSSTPRRATIASDVTRQPGTPLFRYYGFTPNPSTPSVLFSTPVAVTERARTVRIQVNFAAAADRARDVPFTNQVFVRTADPTDPERSPQCL